MATMSFVRRPVRHGLSMVVAYLLLTSAPRVTPTNAVEIDFPPPLVRYQGRTIAQTMHFAGAPWLVRESRQREEDSVTLMRELQLRPGMQVCDMGCGNGFYTIQMAERIQPGGQVFAIDIQPEILHLLSERARKEQLAESITTVLGTPLDPQLPDKSLDLILCVDVYHEFSYPEHMLAAMRRALKPQGVAVLLEFRAEDPRVPIKPLHKMSKRQATREWETNGFRLVREFAGLPWQHMLFFQAEE